MRSLIVTTILSIVSAAGHATGSPLPDRVLFVQAADDLAELRERVAALQASVREAEAQAGQRKVDLNGAKDAVSQAKGAARAAKKSKDADAHAAAQAAVREAERGKSDAQAAYKAALDAVKATKKDLRDATNALKAAEKAARKEKKESGSRTPGGGDEAPAEPRKPGADDGDIDEVGQRPAPPPPEKAKRGGDRPKDGPEEPAGSSTLLGRVGKAVLKEADNGILIGTKGIVETKLSGESAAAQGAVKPGSHLIDAAGKEVNKVADEKTGGVVRLNLGGVLGGKGAGARGKAAGKKKVGG